MLFKLKSWFYGTTKPEKKKEIYILPKNDFGRSILVGQRPYEITLVRLSVFH